MKKEMLGKRRRELSKGEKNKKGQKNTPSRGSQDALLKEKHGFHVVKENVWDALPGGCEKKGRKRGEKGDYSERRTISKGKEVNDNEGKSCSSHHLQDKVVSESENARSNRRCREGAHTFPKGN